MNERIVIITGAAPLLPDVVARIPGDAIVLAADGGLDHALTAGLEPLGLDPVCWTPEPLGVRSTRYEQEVTH